MNILILLEDEKYQPLATAINSNPSLKVVVNNIDFDLTNAIKRAEAILFLGGDEAYNLFCSEYRSLLNLKLVFTTALRLAVTDFEIAITITCGVIVCRVPGYPEEIRSVITEVVGNLFEVSLKQLIADESSYEHLITDINNFEATLENLAQSGMETLPPQIIQQIIGTFAIKNT